MKRIGLCLILGIALIHSNALARPSNLTQKIHTTSNFRSGPQSLKLFAQNKTKNRISAAEAASLAKKRAGGGQVLSTKLDPLGEFYQVKLIEKGRIRVIRIPATRN